MKIDTLQFKFDQFNSDYELLYSLLYFIPFK